MPQRRSVPPVAGREPPDGRFPGPSRTTSGSGSRTRAVVAAVMVSLALLAVALLMWPGVAGGRSAASGSATTTAPAPSRTSATPAVRPGSSAPAVRQSVDPVSGLAWIEVATLPRQARTVLDAIDRGGPYDFDKDGTVFRNAEGLLPRAASGYYREYTVVLPGSDDRGPVRIVVGGSREFFYWTTDHYATFARIRR